MNNFQIAQCKCSLSLLQQCRLEAVNFGALNVLLTLGFVYRKRVKVTSTKYLCHKNYSLNSRTTLLVSEIKILC